MIDNFALAISHGLIALAVWRLLRRPDLDSPDLDSEAAPADTTGKGRPRA